METQTASAILVSSPIDRSTQREQIQEFVDSAMQLNVPLKLRLPITVYKQPEGRSYFPIRDAAWNLTLQANTDTTGQVETLISAMDTFVRAIGRVGADGVIDLLRPSA